MNGFCAFKRARVSSLWLLSGLRYLSSNGRKFVRQVLRREQDPLLGFERSRRLPVSEREYPDGPQGSNLELRPLRHSVRRPCR